MRKPTILVSDQVRDKPGYSHRSRIEASNFGFKKKRDCTIPVAKMKALISCAATAQLICAFVFAYANCWFSCAAAHIHTNDKSGMSIWTNIFEPRHEKKLHNYRTSINADQLHTGLI